MVSSTLALRAMRIAAIVIVLEMALAVNNTPSVVGHDNANCKWSTLYASQEYGYDYYVRWYFEDPSAFSQSFQYRIQDGATKWNNVGRMLYFGAQTSWSIAVDVTIKWRLLGWPNEGALAVSTNSNCPMVSQSITFNSQYNWYKGTGSPSNTQADALSVATHEWGHNVKLDHSNQQADVMWPYLALGDVKRTLTTHDRSGIIYLYADY